jgi:hypothetical protein
MLRACKVCMYIYISRIVETELSLIIIEGVILSSTASCTHTRQLSHIVFSETLSPIARCFLHVNHSNPSSTRSWRRCLCKFAAHVVGASTHCAFPGRHLRLTRAPYATQLTPTLPLAPLTWCTHKHNTPITICSPSSCWINIHWCVYIHSGPRYLWT